MNPLSSAEKIAIAAAAVKRQADQAAAEGAAKLSAVVESAQQSAERFLQT